MYNYKESNTEKMKGKAARTGAADLRNPTGKERTSARKASRESRMRDGG